MNQFLIAAGALTLAIWVYLLGARGGFWRLRAFDADQNQCATPERWPGVVAVIPARNEARTIATVIEAIVTQDYGGPLHVVVVDDHSEDGTGEIARLCATRSDRKVSVVSSPELATGWTGKLWALRQGVERAEMFEPKYFWFTDADIVHGPTTLGRLVASAEAKSLDLNSLMVLLRTNNFAEKLLIPAFVYFFLQLYPPRWIADPGARTAGAAGGCILLRRDALHRIGGLEAIRGEVIDDCALARAVKQSGGTLWMGLTRASRSLRVYAGFGEIRDMIARTAFTQLRYSAMILLGTLLGLMATYILPALLLFSGNVESVVLGAVACILMAITFVPMARFYRVAVIAGLALPFVAVFYAYATWLSALRYWLGRGGQWKGRAQAQKA